MNQQFALEQHGSESVAPPAVANSLHSDTFADPQAFLKALQQSAPKIAAVTDGEMTKNDLIVYSQSASNDPTGKAAALIAANHFDELQQLSKPDLHTNGIIGPDELQSDLKHYKGQVEAEIIKDTISYGFDTAVLGVTTLGFGVIAAFSVAECPTLGVALGAAAFGSLLAFGQTGDDMVDASSSIRANAARTHEALDSWPEINNGVSHLKITPQSKPDSGQKPDPSPNPATAPAAAPPPAAPERDPVQA